MKNNVFLFQGIIVVFILFFSSCETLVYEGSLIVISESPQRTYALGDRVVFKYSIKNIDGKIPKRLKTKRVIIIPPDGDKIYKRLKKSKDGQFYFKYEISGNEILGKWKVTLNIKTEKESAKIKYQFMIDQKTIDMYSDVGGDAPEQFFKKTY